MADEPQAGAGTGAVVPGAFDPAEFRSSLLAEIRAEFTKSVNGAVNGAGKLFRQELEKQKATKSEESLQHILESTEPPPAPEQGKEKPNLPPELNAELQNQRKQIKQLLEKVTAAETKAADAETKRLETDRVSAIKTILADMPFRDDKHRAAAFKAVSSDIRRDDDGNLVADSDSGVLPAKDYIEATIQALDGFLTPRTNGGSGAAPGKIGSPGRAPDLNDIKPRMTPAEYAEFGRVINANLQAGHQ